MRLTITDGAGWTVDMVGLALTGSGPAVSLASRSWFGDGPQRGGALVNAGGPVSGGAECVQVSCSR